MIIQIDQHQKTIAEGLNFRWPIELLICKLENISIQINMKGYKEPEYFDYNIYVTTFRLILEKNVNYKKIGDINYIYFLILEIQNTTGGDIKDQSIEENKYTISINHGERNYKNLDKKCFVLKLKSNIVHFNYLEQILQECKQEIKRKIDLHMNFSVFFDKVFTGEFQRSFEVSNQVLNRGYIFFKKQSQKSSQDIFYDTNKEHFQIFEDFISNNLFKKYHTQINNFNV